MIRANDGDYVLSHSHQMLTTALPCQVDPLPGEPLGDVDCRQGVLARLHGCKRSAIRQHEPKDKLFSQVRPDNGKFLSLKGLAWSDGCISPPKANKYHATSPQSAFVLVSGTNQHTPLSRTG